MSELRLQEYSPDAETDHVPPTPLIEQEIGADWDLGTVTLEAFGTPVTQIISEVATQLDISVLVPQEAQNKNMTASYKGTPGQAVIEDIAEYLGMVPDWDGQTVRFVEADSGTYDFIVIRAGYKPASQIVEDLQALLGPNASVRSVDDRVVVTGNRRDLKRVQALQEHLNYGPDGWRLNIRIVGVTESFRRSLGLDWELGASMSIDLTNPKTYDATAIVQVVAEATETRTDAILYDTATMFVLEGSSSQVNQGRKVPVPRYQTSPEGTTTIVGYDYVDAGFNLRASAQRVPVGVRLKLEPTVSSVIGYVNDAPITDESSVQADIVMRSGEWVVLTGLSTEQTADTRSRIPGMPRTLGTATRNTDKTSLLVLVQAQRVFSQQ